MRLETFKIINIVQLSKIIVFLSARMTNPSVLAAVTHPSENQLSKLNPNLGPVLGRNTSFGAIEQRCRDSRRVPTSVFAKVTTAKKRADLAAEPAPSFFSTFTFMRNRFSVLAKMIPETHERRLPVWSPTWPFPAFCLIWYSRCAKNFFPSFFLTRSNSNSRAIKKGKNPHKERNKFLNSSFLRFL